MSLLGHVKNGVVVLDEPGTLPEGTQVRVEVLNGQTTDSTVQRTNDPQVAARFHHLAEEWRNAIKPLSSMTKIVEHPAYQQIIALGTGVIPLLLGELDRDPDLWFAALKTLTGANPVAPEDRGRLDRMAAAWLRWGREHGHIS